MACNKFVPIGANEWRGMACKNCQVKKKEHIIVLVTVAPPTRKRIRRGRSGSSEKTAKRTSMPRATPEKLARNRSNSRVGTYGSSKATVVKPFKLSCSRAQRNKNKEQTVIIVSDSSNALKQAIELELEELTGSVKAKIEKPEASDTDKTRKSRDTPVKSKQASPRKKLQCIQSSNGLERRVGMQSNKLRRRSTKVKAFNLSRTKAERLEEKKKAETNESIEAERSRKVSRDLDAEISKSLKAEDKISTDLELVIDTSTSNANHDDETYNSIATHNTKHWSEWSH